MLTMHKTLLAAAVGGLILLAGATNAQAQPRFGPFHQGTFGVYSPGVNPNTPFYNPVNPLMRVAPGYTMQQANFNLAQNMQAAFSAPPWAYGYNPYPSPIFNNGPIIPPVYGNPYNYGGGGYANPYGGGGYGANPYSSSLSYANPYGASGYGAYGGYGSSYSNMLGALYYPEAGQLFGQASLNQAQGQLMINSEMARTLREQYNQAKLKTKKEALDTENYIRDHTQSFTEEQQKIAQNTLKRIQTTATVSEIVSGRALNVLLTDLRLHKDKRVGSNPAVLDEDLLKRLNVTLPTAGNLGLLRNDGQFTWPIAMTDVVPADARKDISIQTELLYRQALNDKVNPNVLKDLEASVDKLGEVLRSKMSEVPTAQYLEGKRFLGDFQEAIRALRNNVAPQVIQFKQFAAGGKTAQELADYMLSHGLVFAPAVSGDEGAYQAAFGALANLDIAVNAQQTASR